MVLDNTSYRFIFGKQSSTGIQNLHLTVTVPPRSEAGNIEMLTERIQRPAGPRTDGQGGAVAAWSGHFDSLCSIQDRELRPAIADVHGAFPYYVDHQVEAGELYIARE